MSDKISMIMVPALDEIASYTGENVYYCGLEITKDSINSLLDDIRKEFHKEARASDREAWPSLDVDAVVGLHEHRHQPELLFELVTTISSGTVAVGFYKLLNLWISARTGRKIRVKLPNGLQIETTQLTYRQFCKLFSELYNYESSGEALSRTLESQGHKALNEASVHNEERKLRNAYSKKRKELEQKRGKQK
jgi:hypothetical protein